MLSNNDIISQYYNSILSIAKKVYSCNLSFDIANDISIRLLESDNDKLNELHDNKEFEKYVYRVIVNEKINKYSPSNKLYTSNIELPNYLTIELSDEKINVNEFIHILSPYELKLLTVYSEMNNYLKIANKYKIRRATLHDDMELIREKIKKHLKNKL